MVTMRQMADEIFLKYKDDLLYPIQFICFIYRKHIILTHV